MKPAAQQHRYRKWSLRHMEVSGGDFQFGMVFSSVLHLFLGRGLLLLLWSISGLVLHLGVEATICYCFFMLTC
jgi:hypothetical protein